MALDPSMNCAAGQGHRAAFVSGTETSPESNLGWGGPPQNTHPALRVVNIRLTDFFNKNAFVVIGNFTTDSLRGGGCVFPSD